MKNFDLEISIEGFSGPFDLLCSLVENRKFRACDIKVSKLVKIYGLYLIKTKQAAPDTLAEFVYMASGLILEKTRSLLNMNPNTELEDQAQIQDYDFDRELDYEQDLERDEKFMQSLERYKPYRAAYKLLSEKFSQEQKSFRREIIVTDEPAEKPKLPVEYNIIENGVYLLVSEWRRLHDEFEKLREKLQAERDALSNADWDGFQNSGDDVQQIQIRINELENILQDYECLSLNDICSSSRAVLVVTILALLEMCRMGKVFVRQDALFSDVKIIRNF